MIDCFRLREEVISYPFACFELPRRETFELMILII